MPSRRQKNSHLYYAKCKLQFRHTIMDKSFTSWYVLLLLFVLRFSSISLHCSPIQFSVAFFKHLLILLFTVFLRPFRFKSFLSQFSPTVAPIRSFSFSRSNLCLVCFGLLIFLRRRWKVIIGRSWSLPMSAPGKLRVLAMSTPDRKRFLARM